MNEERKVTENDCIKLSDCHNYGVVKDTKGNYELWKLGNYGYKAGYVSDPGNIDYAIDNHEEELRYLMAEAALEF